MSNPLVFHLRQLLKLLNGLPFCDSCIPCQTLMSLAAAFVLLNISSVVYAQNPAPTPQASPSPTPATAPVSPLSAGLNSLTGVLLPGDRTPPPAHGWVVTGSVDGRFRNATTGTSHTIYLNDVELDIGHPIYAMNRFQGNIYAQVIDENVPDASGGQGPTRDVALGQAYVSYHLPIQTDTGSSVYLEVGQFPLPVGLLPVYDTHDSILQTLAPLGIGERNDFGIEVFGRFNGIIDYRVALTSGQGADHISFNPNKVLSFRLARLFSTPYGIVTFGGSLLSGKLPVSEVDPATGFAPVLTPSGRVTPEFGFVNKTRIAGDVTWVYRSFTARVEAMTGSDNQTTVGGFFAMGEYEFVPGISATISRTYWDYGIQDSTSGDTGYGLQFTPMANLQLSALYEDRRDVPYFLTPTTGSEPTTHLRHIFTVQALVRF
jgi:hypothetical protein